MQMGYHLVLDQANSSLWTAFGRKQKLTQRQIISFTLLTKVFILVKSWGRPIRDFREKAKWKRGFGYPGVQTIYYIAVFCFLWSPVSQWPHCGNALLLHSEEFCNNSHSYPRMLLLAASPGQRNELHTLWKGLPWRFSLLLLGCIYGPGYKESKHAMSWCVTGNGQQEKSQPESPSCGLFVAIVYLQSAWKSFYPNLFGKLVIVSIPKSFIYVSYLHWSEKMK